jgi:ATP-dependent RNA helicase MSS116
LAQAKTGTGKTIAFLLPVLQNIISADPSLAQRRRGSSSHSSDIRSIIISPTRELAEQIAVEAKKVAFNTGVIVQTAVGGSRKMEGLHRIKRQGCHILVATPGRLKDILSDSRNGISAPNLTSFVLDEADRLLDDGFGPEINEIHDYLPDPIKVDRQTLMFSATVPREVLRVVERFMKPDYQFIKAVSEDDVPTHLRVPQKQVVLRGLENVMPSILEITSKYAARREQDPNLRPFKAIVYFNSTSSVQLYYDAFAQLRNDPADRRSGNPFGRGVYCMHSKLSQMQRTMYSESFRRAAGGILISSDVTARGMDFPDVTHVIQVGHPRDRESYIHRLGRTGRANKEGEGWILLHSQEIHPFERALGDLPIKEDRSIESAKVDMSQEGQQVSATSAENLKRVEAAMKTVDYGSKAAAFRAELSVLSGTFRRRHHVVSALNALAIHGWKLPEPPAIARSLADKLGYRNEDELNVSDNVRSSYPEDSGKGRSQSSGSRRSSAFGGSDRFNRNDRSSRDDRFSRNDRSSRDDRFSRNDRSSRDDRFSRDDGPSRNRRSFDGPSNDPLDGLFDFENANRR